MAKTSLELIAVPTSARTPHPQLQQTKSSIGPIAVSAVALALAGAWGWYGSSVYDQGLTKLDELQLERASGALRIATEEAQRAVEAEVRTLSDDARVREPLATPGIDDATLADVLADLKSSTGASIVALLTPAGSVRVVDGADSMKKLDLSSSSLMNPGDKGVASAKWLLPDRMAAVAVAPIRLGSNVAAHLLVGRDLGGSALALVKASTGVFGAVFVQDKVVATTIEKESAALNEASRMEGDRTVSIDGGRYVGRVERIDSARGGKISWIIPRHHGSATMSFGPEVWWSPLGLVFLGTLLWWGLERRRMQPEEGKRS